MYKYVYMYKKIDNHEEIVRASKYHCNTKPFVYTLFINLAKSVYICVNLYRFCCFFIIESYVCLVKLIDSCVNGLHVR